MSGATGIDDLNPNQKKQESFIHPIIDYKIHTSNRVLSFGRISRGDEKIANQLETLKEALKAGSRSSWIECWEAQEVHTAFGEDGRFAKRKLIKEILSMAEKHMFDILFLYHSDRLTRQGGTELLNLIFKFQSYGIRIVSLQEGDIDAPEYPSALTDVMLRIRWFMTGEFAMLESIRNSERVKNRNEQAKREAKLTGTKPRLGGGAGKHEELDKNVKEQILYLNSLGMGYSSVADKLSSDLKIKLTVWDVRNVIRNSKKVL